MTRRRPLTTRPDLKGQGIKGLTCITVICGTAAAYTEIRVKPTMTIIITVHDCRKIDEAGRGETNYVELATEEGHNLFGFSGSGLAASTRPPTPQGALDACILALTSPELLRRRRRACIPVTRRRR